MITKTFCHIPGIGPKKERNLWKKGLLTWDDLNNEIAASIDQGRREIIKHYCKESAIHLADSNASFFASLLPSSETWRLYPDFEDKIAYLDIETTGLSGYCDCITTIAIYDGKNIYTFVQGKNLDEFADFISDYKLIVTFNGKTFDIPFIRQQLGIAMDQAHIDLRHVLGSVGMKGGLKKCEKQLGIDRKELTDVDGYFAVLLWQNYIRTGREEYLETLLAYNAADVVNLATIMPIAYNMKIKDTPFRETNTLPPTDPAPIPYKAHTNIIEQIRYATGRL